MSAHPGGTGSFTRGMIQNLEGFISATRELENALSHERQKSQKLAEDLRQSTLTYERMINDQDAKLRELASREARAQAALHERQRREDEILSKARALREEYRGVRDELNRYKLAWAGVLQREREARMILSDSEANARRQAEVERKLSELEREKKELERIRRDDASHREQLERHAKSYQVELQNALVRLHSAESRFNELNQEYQTLLSSRRQADDEIARIEQTIRERYQWEVAKEREQLKADLERQAAIEREQFREETRRSIRAELEEQMSQERKRHERTVDALQVEIACLKEGLFQAKAETQRQLGAAHAETSRLTQELSDTGARLSDLRAQATELQQEVREGEAVIRHAEALKRNLEEVQRELAEVRDQKSDLLIRVTGYESALEKEFERVRELETSLVTERERFAGLHSQGMELVQLQRELERAQPGAREHELLLDRIEALIEKQESLRKTLAVVGHPKTILAEPAGAEVVSS